MKFSKDERAFIAAVKEASKTKAARNFDTFLMENPVVKAMASQDMTVSRKTLFELLLGEEPEPPRRQPEPPPVPFDPQAPTRLYGPKKD